MIKQVSELIQKILFSKNLIIKYGINIKGENKKVKGMASYKSVNGLEYTKIVFLDGSFLYLVPNDNEIYFSEKYTITTGISWDKIGNQSEIIFQNQTYKLANKDDYQYVIEFHIGSIDDIEGECKFTDYECLDDKNTFISFAVLSNNGQRADIKPNKISLDNVVLPFENKKTPYMFDMANEILKKIEFENHKKIIISPGSIIRYREGINIGNEISKPDGFKRIGIALGYSKHTGTILVAPLTTKYYENLSEYCLEIQNPEKNGIKKSYIYLHQIKTISQKRVCPQRNKYKNFSKKFTIKITEKYFEIIKKILAPIYDAREQTQRSKVNL